MSTAETDYTGLRTATIAQMLAMVSDPKPSYQVGDRRLDWNAYYKNLKETLELCDKQLGLMASEEMTVYDDPTI